MPPADLEQALALTGAVWSGLRGARIFVTGGTGFFGGWILELLSLANERFALRAEAVVLSRDPEAFRRSRPHLCRASGVTLHAGDSRSFAFPEGRFTHIIHAAASSDAALYSASPDLMRETIVEGTRRVLAFAEQREVLPFLYVSSGAVYGKQPAGVSRQPEGPTSMACGSSPAAVHAEAKVAAESLCLDHAARWGLQAKIARPFAFVGPGLPLDSHFAAGNFIRDALGGPLIRVRGDGTPYRSYLYASDMAVWLWTILLRGEPCRPYNVGSERRISILELAHLVASLLRPDARVEVLGKPVPGGLQEQYVPSTERARSELGLRESVTLEDAVRRTAAWAAESGCPP